jgi:hypothetical protein
LCEHLVVNVGLGGGLLDGLNLFRTLRERVLQEPLRRERRSVFASVFEVSIVFDLRRASLRASLEPGAVFS